MKLTNVRRRISQCIRLEAPGSSPLPPLHPEQPKSDDDSFVVAAVIVPPCDGIAARTLLRISVNANGHEECEFSWPIHDLMVRYRAASSWLAGLAALHRVMGDLLGLHAASGRDDALPAETMPRPAGLLSPGLVLAHAIVVPPRSTIVLAVEPPPLQPVAVHLEGLRTVRAW